YTVSATNAGETPLTGVELVDTLPEGVEFVSATDGGAYDDVTHTVTWPGFDLDLDQTLTRTVTVTVADEGFDAGDHTLINTVTGSDDGEHGTDVDQGNNSDDAPVIVTVPEPEPDPVPVLTVTKDVTE